MFLNQLQIISAEKNDPGEKCGNHASSFLKFFATPLPALVVGEEIWSLVLGPPTSEMLPPTNVAVPNAEMSGHQM